MGEVFLGIITGVIGGGVFGYAMGMLNGQSEGQSMAERRERTRLRERLERRTRALNAAIKWMEKVEDIMGRPSTPPHVIQRVWNRYAVARSLCRRTYGLTSRMRKYPLEVRPEDEELEDLDKLALRVEEHADLLKSEFKSGTK